MAAGGVARGGRGRGQHQAQHAGHAAALGRRQRQHAGTEDPTLGGGGGE